MSVQVFKCYLKTQSTYHSYYATGMLYNPELRWFRLKTRCMLFLCADQGLHALR